MSHQSPESPTLPCLPRRRFLQALSVAPLAAVTIPEPGQALFSSHASHPLSVLEDERFEVFRRLITEEWRLIDIEINAECNDPERAAKEAASGAASDAVEDFMREVWSKPVKSQPDLLLRARIMEFADLRYNADNDIWHCYAEPARHLVAGHLEFFGANPSFGVLAGRVDKGARFLGVTAEDMQTAIASDSRFAKLDKLLLQSIDLEVRENEAFLEHDAATVESCNAEHGEDPLGPSPWVILHSRLRREIDNIAALETETTCRGWLDLALQNKLADYYVTVGDADGGEFNAIVTAFIRNSLRFWTFEPQKSIDELKPPKPCPVPEPDAPSPRQQLHQLVSDTRTRIRKADQRLRKAVRWECSLEDGTPAHLKAVRTSKRRQAELDRLTDRLMPKWDSFPMADGYQLQCDLLAAHRPELIESPSSDPAGKILQHLLRYARRHGDWLMEDAASVARQSVVREA